MGGGGGSLYLPTYTVPLRLLHSSYLLLTLQRQNGLDDKLHQLTARPTSVYQANELAQTKIVIYRYSILYTVTYTS